MKTKVAIIKNLNEDKDFINEAGNIIESGGTVHPNLRHRHAA